jgi:hypothetical protein
LMVLDARPSAEGAIQMVPITRADPACLELTG